ncbi:C2 calcium-dependent domain-containing 4C-like [Pelobates cultripes]|uniref:C2 calcium-dependent domain-containing 4C-like n=1 Tax=Pelobates cultripes TaxID=61616 RepID=A0AAD1WY26_PELCU|nr:C2 calcium-dependent domain-containing 4C-like [Pelobates cultripes]
MFHSKKKVLSTCPNILTPDQIPKFFIPPKLSTVKQQHAKSISDTGPNQTPKTLLRSANRHIIQVEYMEPEMGVSEQTHNINFTVPITGSPYLSESPHTRRRESLFHGNFGMKTLSPSDPDCTLRWRSSSSEIDFGGISDGRLESDTTSSAESSPFSSPLLTHTIAGNLVRQVYRNQQLFCRSESIKTLARASSLSNEETSSTDTSPNVSRKKTQENQGTTMMHLVPPPVFHLDFICCQERLTKETEVMLSKGGLVHLSAEYMKELRRLRVKLVSAENLYPPNQDPKTISCYTVMSLQPGKLQKQRSTVIRRSRNPIFNEDFFFEGVEKGELDTRSLRLKVINRGSGMRRDHFLGHIELLISAILPPLTDS